MGGWVGWVRWVGGLGWVGGRVGGLGGLGGWVGGSSTCCLLPSHSGDGWGGGEGWVGGWLSFIIGGVVCVDAVFGWGEGPVGWGGGRVRRRRLE